MSSRRTEHDLLAETVRTERLVYLGETYLGGTPRIAQAGDRRRAGAAGVSGDVDHVGACFGDSDGYGSDALGRHQLHDHAHPRCFAVVDELSEVFDRVRVVMRWGRDEFDSRSATAGRSDLDGDFRRRKLASLTGFGALADLDLELGEHGVGEVSRPDPESARGELLDPRRA
ncbi:Uncharacterised protein [Mycobacteroides abscessus subsp. abscessus]|nr:Uncharacterised protein [Mycobacteroides abscessus subsp. abscessus]